MTYQNKTVKKHKRGNWFARVWYDGKATSIYGKTQIECYEKLKAVVDKIEQDRAEQNALKVLARVGKITNKYCCQIAPQTIELSYASVEPPKTETKRYTFAEWFNEWLYGYKAGGLRANSIMNYKNLFKNLANLHDTEISKIDTIMLTKTLNAKPMCRQSKDIMNSIIKQMFALAHNNKLIESNPALTLPRPKATMSKGKIALTPEQESRMIEIALTDLDKYEPLLICLLQGLRKGEMLAIRPNDIDFEKNTLRVDESYDEAHPSDLQTKNQDSNRIMPMFELTRKILTKYKDLDPTQRIFEKFYSTKLYKHLRELQEKAKLPKFCIHELRHTFITRCHEKRIDEMIVQRWVGHQIGSRMTKAVYTHISNNAEQEYIEKMNGKAS